jgi:hypothetical protein
MAEDAIKDEQMEDSSDSENDEELEEESSTSEESEDSDDASEEAEEEEEKAPFHKHPRFQELVADNREAKEQNKALMAELQALKAEREEAQRLASMTPEEKAQQEAIKKLNLATKSDVAEIKRQNLLLKDKLEFEKFLASNPDAAEHTEAIRAIAYSKDYAKKSYSDIYSKFFGSGQKKVVSRKVRTGIKAKAGGKSQGSKVFTRADIEKMSTQEFAKNEKAIMKQMADGQIK